MKTASEGAVRSLDRLCNRFANRNVAGSTGSPTIADRPSTTAPEADVAEITVGQLRVHRLGAYSFATISSVEPTSPMRGKMMLSARSWASAFTSVIASAANVRL